MKTTKVQITTPNGSPILNSVAIVWGNNAAWLCTTKACSTMHGGRTADGETEVQCECSVRYEILRAPNKNGRLNLGPAVGIRQLTD